MEQRIKEIMAASISVKQALLASDTIILGVEQVVQLLVLAFQSGHKVLFCGNGGSAADAQHLAAELSGRFYLDRPPLFAEALHVNSSFLTAVANDYGYEEVFARAVRAMGRQGDVLCVLSTSGHSGNVLPAIQAAKDIGMKVVGFTGASGGIMKGQCDFLIQVPSTDTPRVQECHLLIGHIICELVEAELFKD
ncbi:MAG: SIS domain-containing protein [Saprospiraceae bacterium]|nr:MAG: SIS domain-containing protein [Saprospiraceae bacterium]